MYVDKEDGQKENAIELKVSKEQSAFLEKTLKDYVRNYKLDPSNEEDVKWIEQFMRNAFESKYKHTIRNHYKNTAVQQAELKWRERNGQVIPKKNVSENKSGKIDSIEEYNKESERRSIDAIKRGAY